MARLIGLGTDIIEIERVRKAAENSGGRFTRRIFTPGEIGLCTGRRNPWPCFAARFAAKEAVFKALGTGVTAWHEVEILGGGNQPVQATLTGTAKRIAREKGIDEVLLSISHDRGRAVAFATAIGKEVN
ncbi:holo-ACP synthase [Desulfallas sp. Bu1-1]|jgi:holo-[acyl-carrier protein] synthase|uniref:holo-ACP synthase n=1 Tax=Desulfallas sp. Bu1-1 TaxID=2787620 RepID=UPI00189FB7BF|nr:holo-ACP synthase [Desulfallas sp. Bu1-1]MBF7083160.1 holo-ACP synthase [Desulfallas sp. Bu1-1]